VTTDLKVVMTIFSLKILLNRLIFLVEETGNGVREIRESE
jgi:hypothetical protein